MPTVVEVSRRNRDAIAEQARLRVLSLSSATPWGAGPEPTVDPSGWLPAPVTPGRPTGADPIVSEQAIEPPAARRLGPAHGLTLVERLPAGVRGLVLAAERPAVAGLALVGLASVALAMVVWLLGRPHADAVAPRVGATGVALVADVGGARARAGSSAPAGVVAADVVVDVVGLVRRPGVVTLPSGSRVTDAVAAAGGVTSKADVSSLNLARRLVDGEQIAVLAPGAAPPPGAAAAQPAGGQPAAPGAPLDLNTASLQQLDGLPGVGPVLAQRILDWRLAHGRFSTVDELREVTGIGDSRFGDLKPLVRV